MKVKDLKALLEIHGDRINDLDILVEVALPSFGPIASEKVTSAYIGFDWDKDLILQTTTLLVPKEENQSVFETAYDLLVWIATKPVARETYEVRRAKQILMSYGKTQEDLDKLRKLFHEK